MVASVFTLMFLLIFSCGKKEETQQKAEADVKTYGTEMTMNAATSLAELYQHPEQYEGKEIRLDGQIVDVCQKKGCWLKLKQGEYDITVRFKDYAFFVPKDGAGNLVSVQGIFSTKTDKHVEEETAVQGAEVKEEKPSYSFTASSVVIKEKSES